MTSKNKLVNNITKLLIVYGFLDEFQLETIPKDIEQKAIDYYLGKGLDCDDGFLANAFHCKIDRQVFKIMEFIDDYIREIHNEKSKLSSAQPLHNIPEQEKDDKLLKREG